MKINGQFIFLARGPKRSNISFIPLAVSYSSDECFDSFYVVFFLFVDAVLIHFICVFESSGNGNVRGVAG